MILYFVVGVLTILVTTTVFFKKPTCKMMVFWPWTRSKTNRQEWLKKEHVIYVLVLLRRCCIWRRIKMWSNWTGLISSRVKLNPVILRYKSVRRMIDWFTEKSISLMWKNSSKFRSTHLCSSLLLETQQLRKLHSQNQLQFSKFVTTLQWLHKIKQRPTTKFDRLRV